MNRGNEIKLTLWGSIANEIDDNHFKRNPRPFIIVATCLTVKTIKGQHWASRRSVVEPQSVAGSWQLIIKVAGFKNQKKKERCAYVYEAINPQGVGMFFGVNSNLARTATGCLLEVVVEANLTASNHGFNEFCS